MTSAASDVFISYKAEERKRLVPLVEAFQAEGFSVWWDQHIGGGTNWREEIESHLDAARVVIVVWSKRSISPEGRFVRDEAAQAQETGRYLPITVDNVRPPLGFREIQALDLSSWWGKRDDPRFKILCETIRHRLEGKDIPRNLVAPKGARIDRRTAI
ncbi:MAG TPA: toll/interleukin-1 receptor domain-containing protein, partial [Sphingomicrobium sp.]|nr:toll/interleukin-1 receptor domain-containing protein [Sphingomicrobium sp.]